MKAEKTKRLSLSEFVKKYKKEHSKLKSQQATRKAKAEYKKYIKNIKKKKREDKELAKLRKTTESDEEFEELKNFDKKMSEED